MKEFLEKLIDELKGASRIVFLGIGEEKMRDDAVGPYVITHLLDLTNEKYLFINAGVDPMARKDEIVAFNPTHMVIIDSCTLNADPGTVAIIKRKNMYESVSISSHTIPIHIVIDLIVSEVGNLNTFMIGVVPESLDGFTTLDMFGEGKYSLDEINDNENLPFWDIHLTDTIQEVADGLIEIIKELTQKL